MGSSAELVPPTSCELRRCLSFIIRGDLRERGLDVLMREALAAQFVTHRATRTPPLAMSSAGDRSRQSLVVQQPDLAIALDDLVSERGLDVTRHESFAKLGLGALRVSQQPQRDLPGSLSRVLGQTGAAGATGRLGVALCPGARLAPATQKSAFSSSSAPASGTMPTPSFALTFCSISTASSGLSLRKWRAFSLP